MKAMRMILTGLLCLILFFSNCSSDKEKEEEVYSLKVKTVANVCVTHEGVPVGAGVVLWVLLFDDDNNESLGLYLVTQNLSTDESGCISLVTPYYDMCDGCTFQFHAAIQPEGIGSNVFLTSAEASAGAVESDDGNGKIYTWNVNMALSY